ncbi:MAG: hypothetical protein KGH62_02950, partial [Candidatus Micrarchaeota archaeon]|nr:hypothetical protein [Candidatus Micrarchaeota archaeon]
MLTKTFFPHGHNTPIEMSVFLKSVRRDALMEPDSALGKLLKNGASESAAGNNENAALFFTQAAGMLMAHGV